MPFSRQQSITVLLLLGGLGLLAYTLLGFAPRTITIDVQDTSLVIHAQPGMVLSSAGCVQLDWAIGGIQTIALNGQPTTGGGEQSVCLDAAAPPTFRIAFPDGSTEQVRVPVPVLVQQPLFWLGLGLLLVGGLRWASSWRRTPGATTESHTWRKVALALGSVALTLGMLEIGLRYVIANSDNEEARIMYLYSLEDIRRLDDRLIPMPYINYLPAPNFDEHNALGYRGPEIALPKPEGVYRIVALGGSTTYSTGTTADQSYPALLQAILREEYGYTNVEVINAGFQGYSSWESLVNLAFRVLELEPDRIIHYAAINDLLPREQLSADCYRGENVLRGLNGIRGFWTERATDLSSSALLRFIGINMGWMENPLALQSAFNPPRLDCADDGGISMAERLERNPPVYFERNLRSMIGIAQAHDVDVLLSTWAYYVDGDHPDPWRAAIAAHNAITEALAQEFALPLVDLAETLPVDASYWEPDGVHFVATGTREQAQQYAAFLVENDLLPAP